MKGVLSESGERTEGGCSHQSGVAIAFVLAEVLAEILR